MRNHGLRGVTLSQETQALLAKNPQGFDAIRLNWRLLSEAYPEEIKTYQSYRLDRDEGVSKLVNAAIQAEPTFESREDVLARWNEIRVRPTDFSPNLLQVLADHRGTESLRRLDLFARSQALRQEWKLEPHWMVLINQKYGPVDYNAWDNHLSLDWRSAFSHSLYWAMRGLQFVQEGEHSFDELRLRRSVYHSLQGLRHYGRMQIYQFAEMPAQRDPGQEVLTAEPVLRPRLFLSQDLRMFAVAYQETLDIIQGRIDAGEEPPAGVVDGSQNLALSGITDLHLAGYPKMARAYWNDLCKRYPDEPRYHQSMESFIRSRLKEQIEDIDPKTASNVINSLLRDFYGEYAIADDDTASQMEEFARQIHLRYSSEFGGEDTGRVAMPSFSEMSWIALVDFFKDAGRDPALKSLLLGRLEVEKPDQYEKVLEALKREGISREGTP